MMSAAFLCALICHILFLGASATPSHGDVYLSCDNLPYTSKGTVFVYDGSKGDYVNICKECFDQGAAAAACRQLGYVDADIAEPGYDDTPLEYFTDAFTLGGSELKGAVSVYNAILGSLHEHLKRFDQRAVAAVEYIDADIAEPLHNDITPKYTSPIPSR